MSAVEDQDERRAKANQNIEKHSVGIVQELNEIRAFLYPLQWLTIQQHYKSQFDATLVDEAYNVIP